MRDAKDYFMQDELQTMQNQISVLNLEQGVAGVWGHTPI